MQHMEHGVHVMNRDSEMGMRRPDEYRDSQALQSGFMQGAHKRVRMDGGKDM